MKRIMAIYDTDPCYADKFAEFVNRREQCPFTAVSFTSVEHLQAYAGRQQVELLLAGSGVKSDSLDEVSAAQTVWLAGDHSGRGDGGAVVYQYQSADSVLREVIACYQRQTSQSLDTICGISSNIIGVYSPVNRCGKTGFCLTLGRILARDSRVLYISLEENSGFTRLMGREHKTCLADFIYYFRQRTEQGMSLASFVYSLDELDYIPPVIYGEDLAQLTLEELEQILSYVGRCGGYDIIIVDFAQFGKGIEQLFSICSRLYIPVLDDSISQAKLEEWQHFLEYSGQANLWEQMEMIRVPAQREAPADTILDQLLWGETGGYIRKLLQMQDKETPWKH